VTAFRDKFAEIRVKHDIMRSHFLQEKVDEIQRSDVVGNLKIFVADTIAGL